MKQLLLSGLVMFGLLSGGYFLKQVKFNNGEEARYTPRVMSAKEEGEIRGYFEYLKKRRANPATGVVSYEDLMKAKKEIMAMSSTKAGLGLNWKFKGPDNVGGRTRAFLVDNKTSGRVWAGGIAGGLFYSDDHGGTWTEFASLADNLAISCIAQLDNGRIFVGTGSSHETSKSGTGGRYGTPGFIGAGLFEVNTSTGSLDPILGYAADGGTIPVNSTSGDFALINQLAAKGNILYMATGRGLKIFDPAKAVDVSNPNKCSQNPYNPIFISASLQFTSTIHDVDVHTDGTVAVASNGGVWVSSNGACNSFTQVSLSGARVEVSIAPSNSSYIYAAAVTSSGCLSGIYQSVDKGKTFKLIGPPGSSSFQPYVSANCQGSYDNSLDVNPDNEGFIILGGVQLYKWEEITPGNGQWTMIATTFGDPRSVNPYYVHADKHRIVFEDSSTVWVTSDGGVARSLDAGNTWTQNNFGYSVTTFYSMAVSNNGYVMGGAQDNGTQMVGLLSDNSGLNSLEIRGGDGFDCDFSNVAQMAYSSVYYGALARHGSQSFSAGNFWDNELDGICNSNGDGSGTCGPFYTAFRYWESFYDPTTKDSLKYYADSTMPAGTVISYGSLTNEDIKFQYTLPVTLQAGDSIMVPDYIRTGLAFSTGSDLFFTRMAAREDLAPDWHKISTVSNITDIEFSKDGNYCWFTNGSSLYRIANLSLAYDSITTDVRSSGCVLVEVKATLSNGSATITGVAIDPNDPDNVIATLGNYNLGNHVYRCTNGTSASPSFSPIQGSGSTKLPSMPVYDAVIDMNDPNKVVVGTDWGVFATSNAFSGTPQWSEENTGMAHTPTFEVRQIDDPWILAPGYSGMIYIGTHGRGFFATDGLVSTPEIPKDEVIKEEVSQLKIFPNPTSDFGYFDFILGTSSNVSYQIYNLNGDMVQSKTLGKLVRGKHQVRFNIADLPGGTYLVSFKAGDQQHMSKIIKTH